MKNKRVFIFAYARTNLGDDLFIVELLKRYSNIEFYIDVKDKSYAKAFEKFNNIHITIGNIENFDDRIPEEYDGYVYVGGSIFMEGGVVYNLDEGCNRFIKKCKEKNIPFFYMSSNFGPYQTQTYFNLAIDTFKNCTDICFRDMYSYNLFKDISTVRYSPDLIFSLEEKPTEIIKDSIGISVIDMSIRESLKKYENTYIKSIVNNILEYIKKDKKIYLFSFCKAEKDDNAIEKIILQLPQELRSLVNIVSYDGDIEKYLLLYKKMENMICCRFHSMVLSVAFNQKFFVLSYSKKIDNVIKDLELTNKYMNIGDLNENTLINLDDFKKIDSIKTQEIKTKAIKQLDKIENWLKL